jgi:protein-disulfide isomerase
VSKKHVQPKKTPVAFYALIGLVAVVGAYVLYTVTRPAAPVSMAVDPTAPPSEAKGYLLGDPNAPFTITEFADFECPGCGQFAALHGPDIKTRIVDKGLANFRFYDFPLQMHRNALSAHLAAACANDQGQFWPMHDRIFNGQIEWNTQATTNPKKVLAGYAEGLGLDMGAWNSCFDSRQHMGEIEANQKLGIRLGVGQTPTVQIAGRLYPGGLTTDQLKTIIDSMWAARAATPAGQ